jgi:hypothetical protein
MTAKPSHHPYYEEYIKGPYKYTLNSSTFTGNAPYGGWEVDCWNWPDGSNHWHRWFKEEEWDSAKAEFEKWRSP